MSYSQTKPVQTTAARTWMPGQKQYVMEFLQPFKQVFGGDYSAPLIQNLMRMMESAGLVEASRERAEIGASPALTQPAKQRMFSDLTGKTLSTIAGVPGKMTESALDILRQYALTIPGVATKQSGGGTTGAGLCSSCYIFKSFNEGYLEDDVRLFRDTHFPKGGYVDKGYRWMSNWLVPTMEKHPITKHFVRLLMILPLSLYARWYYHHNKYGFVFIPCRIVWPVTWSMLGRLAYIMEG